MPVFAGATLCQLANGSDDNGDDDGAFGARRTKRLRNNMNKVENKSSTVACNIHTDNNCRPSDKHSNRPEIRN